MFHVFLYYKGFKVNHQITKQKYIKFICETLLHNNYIYKLYTIMRDVLVPIPFTSMYLKEKNKEKVG